MRILFLAAMLSFLTACDEYCYYVPNNKERQRIFKECLQAVPAGPQQTHYNDWSEVVDECDDVAYYQSKERVCK